MPTSLRTLDDEVGCCVASGLRLPGDIRLLDVHGRRLRVKVEADPANTPS